MASSEEIITINYMENFLSVHRPKIQQTHNVFISLTMIKTLNYVQFYAKCNTLMTYELSGFSDALGTHLAKGCTESIAIRHRGSQTELGALVA